MALADRYAHVMNAGIDTGIFECDICGALVTWEGTGKHDAWHAAIAAATRKVADR